MEPHTGARDDHLALLLEMQTGLNSLATQLQNTNDKVDNLANSMTQMHVSFQSHVCEHMEEVASNLRAEVTEKLDETKRRIIEVDTITAARCDNTFCSTAGLSPWTTVIRTPGGSCDMYSMRCIGGALDGSMRVESCRDAAHLDAGVGSLRMASFLCRKCRSSVAQRAGI